MYDESEAGVLHAPASERIAFLKRTYGHLAGAVAGFVALEALLFQSGLAAGIAQFAFNTSWLVFLGGFMLVGWIASRFAHSDASPAGQYVALGVYVLAEAILFVPLLYIAVEYSDPRVLPAAALITLSVFSGLTGMVFIGRWDFSFLRAGLTVAAFLALGLIVAALIFGLSLGIWFSVAMVALASAFILYDTSNVLHHYRTDQHVAASLELFASVALLFWYVLRIFIASRD